MGAVPILGPRPIVQWMHDGARYAVEHGPLWDLITRGEILFYPSDPQKQVQIKVVNPQKSWETNIDFRFTRGRESVGTKISPDYNLVLSGDQTVWVERTPRSIRYESPGNVIETQFAVYQPIDGWNTMAISRDTLAGKYRGAGGGILSDIIKGTLFVAASVGVANLAGLAGAGAGVTGVAPGAVAVAPSEWTLATAGMGEGMGSGGLLATVAPTVPVQAVAPVAAASAPSLPTLAQIGGAAQTAVQTVQQAASSIVGVAAAIETVKAATNPPEAQTVQKQSADSSDISPILIGVGVLVLVLLT